MAAIQNVLLVLVVFQIALTLAKPYEELFDSSNDGTFASMRENIIEKRSSAGKRIRVRYQDENVG